MPRTRPGDAQFAAWRALFTTQALITRELEEDLTRECGLSMVDYEVLLNLALAPGNRLRHQELVRCARLTKSGISRLVDRLEAAGWIANETCASDRRGAFAVLTAAGSRLQKRAAVVHLRGIEELFGSRLTDAQARQLEALMLSIRSGLVEVAGSAPA